MQHLDEPVPRLSQGIESHYIAPGWLLVLLLFLHVHQIEKIFSCQISWSTKTFPGKETHSVQWL